MPYVFYGGQNGSMEETPVSYQMVVNIFGAKPSPSYANFCLQQTALDCAHLYYPTILNIVHNNFYVNNCLFSVSSVEEAIFTQKLLCKLFKRLGFHVQRKWLSNNKQIIKTIPDSKRATYFGK